jgi:hypothetical protein
MRHISSYHTTNMKESYQSSQSIAKIITFHVLSKNEQISGNINSKGFMAFKSPMNSSSSCCLISMKFSVADTDTTVFQFDVHSQLLVLTKCSNQASLPIKK